MKTLGLDGIKGVGGSVIMGTNEFDTISHLHMLLDTNRQGVLRALRPKSGATDPELWVDDSVVSYMTMNWDIMRTVKAVEEIANTFGGENFFEDNVMKNASRELNLDFRKDMLEQMNDRVTMAQVVLPEKKINSQSNVIGIHVKDAERVKTVVLPKLFEAARRGTLDGLRNKLVSIRSITKICESRVKPSVLRDQRLRLSAIKLSDQTRSNPWSEHWAYTKEEMIYWLIPSNTN